MDGRTIKAYFKAAKSKGTIAVVRSTSLTRYAKTTQTKMTAQCNAVVKAQEKALHKR